MSFAHRFQLSILILLLFHASLPAQTLPPDAHTFSGIWLPQSAQLRERGHLSEIRGSTLTINSDSFSLSNFRGSANPISGTFVLHPGAKPDAIDLKTQPIDSSVTGSPVNYPSANLLGIYDLNGDVLTVCIQAGANPVRPKSFASNLDNEILLVFRRANADFRGYPKQVAVSVIGPDGLPLPDEHIFQFMSYWHDRKNPTAERKWNYLYEIPITDQKASIDYDELDALCVRDMGRKLIGFVTASPAELQSGVSKIQLQPECELSGTLACDELNGTGAALGWTNVYLSKNFQPVAMCESTDGTYHFPVPPGKYMLDAYGTNILSQCVQIEIPQGKSEYRQPPIQMVASHLAKLRGHAAPELAGIVGWKGKPVTLASLRGQFVLIDFWGYWCDPCVESMPVLMDLHDKYKGKGLSIIGVHVDVNGEIDTAEKLDGKIAGYRESIWKGRDISFPIALSAGNSTPEDYAGVCSAQYGIHGYPTTILIDRAGNVVGTFEARDIAAASKQIDKLTSK